MPEGSSYAANDKNQPTDNDLFEFVHPRSPPPSGAADRQFRPPFHLVRDR